jgi:DNA-binding MarR family transcriptional regulator
MRPLGTPLERHPGLDAKIVAALDRIGEVLQVLARHTAESHDLSPTQLRILVRLYAGPPPAANISALAREFELSDPTVSDAVGVLRRKGLIDRVQDRIDRRHYRLHLTDTGRELAQSVSRWTASAESTTAEIPRSDGEQLLATLLDVLSRMRAAGLVDVTRACTTCRHFQRNPPATQTAPYRCNLFDYPMAPSDLRVDCVEHQTAKEVARHNCEC